MLPRDSYRDVPVLVLGAGGFIGRWVTRLLTAVGADLHVSVRDASAFDSIVEPYGLRARVHVADLSEPGAAAAVCAAVSPAIVFNLAGYGVDATERAQPHAERINRDLPAELAGALSNSPSWSGKTLVHAGSSLEYGPVEGPILDGTPSSPTTLYGITKFAGATAIQRAGGAGLRAAVGRIFMAYGPGEHAHRLLPSLFRARSGGAPIPLTMGAQNRDFVYVEEVAEALLRLGLSERSGFDMVNVATGTLCSVADFVRITAEALGLDANRLKFGELPYRPEEMWHGPVSVSALSEQTGWTPSVLVPGGIRRAKAFEDGGATA
jgi:nucleoside-diphosphate-sugar epimerase